MMRNVSKSEEDINNVFDSIALSEERLSKEGFQEGVNKGIKEGEIDGYHMGYHRGAELGAELVNSHMVNFITNRHWDKLVPEPIKHDFKSLGPEGFYSVFWTCVESDMDTSLHKEMLETSPNLTSFLLNARRMSLGCSDLVLTQSQWKNIVSTVAGGPDVVTSPHVTHFMSPKKSHEVTAMSEVVGMLSTLSSSSHIVDVGSGKGYLSLVLALHHNLKVLGVDSSQVNTHGAANRTRKMQKACKKTCQSAVNIKISDDESLSPILETDYYKQVTAHVTEKTDLVALVDVLFPGTTCHRVALAGLHTCGDLASSCLQAYARDFRLVALCNVGCCYHLMKDSLPMSQHLRSAGFLLEHNSRMLAAQAIERMADTRQLSVEPLFYRALLQVLLVEKCGSNQPSGHVGRLATKCSSFHEYARKALVKLGLSIQVEEEELGTLYRDHLTQRDQLAAYFGLRVSLARVVETVILLDRLLFLHEQRRSCARDRSAGLHFHALFSTEQASVAPRGAAIIDNPVILEVS
uniref:Methyltransferase domain-containing protein n=1 Tax=Timema shepardi TaxID=629360 RepID=A0A7R9B2U4_TIMSH|nr:unnamed protein product [Timema shepardi]